MKMSKRMMALLMCCVLLMTSTNVVWAEKDDAEQTIVGTGAPTAPDGEKQTDVGSVSTPTPAPVVEATATPTPAPVVEATATPAPVVEATATPAPVVEATATPAPVVEATATPAPVVEATATPAPVVEATATPAPVVEATATPAPMRMMGSDISPIGESDPSMNPNWLDPNDPGLLTDYTVTYSVGANTAATKPAPTLVTAGASVPLPPLNPAGGYAFKGWTYLGDYVDDPFIMPSAHVELVAQWEVVTVTISDLDAPVSGAVPDTSVTVTPAGVSEPSVKWYNGETEFSGSNFAPATAYTVKITLTAPAEIPFAANVAAEGYNVARTSDTQIVLSKTFPATAATTYTVTYDVGDNTAATAPQAQQVAEGESVPLPTLATDDNYRFDGWTLNGEKVDETFTMPAQDIELVAAWKAFHTVTYDMGANTDAASMQAVRLAVGDAVPLPTLEPVGRYFFTKWWYDYGYYGPDKPLVMPDKDITVVAYWNPIHVIRNYRWRHTDLIAFAETTLLNSHENEDIFIGNTVTISPHLEMDGYRDDHERGIRASFAPAPDEESQQLTISADLSKNELTFECVLLIPIQPVSSELVYNGQQQSVSQWKQADNSLLGGYTPDFSNYTFTVGTNVGTYKPIGDWDPIPVTADKTGMFGARYLEFKEGLSIVKAPLATAHLTLTPPSDPVYSGTAKAAKVELASPYTGAGEFTVKYYADAALTNEVQPINVGTYYVGVTAPEGDNFLAATEPVYAGSFTIARKEIANPVFAAESEERTFGFDNDEMKRYRLVSGYDKNTMTLANNKDMMISADGYIVVSHAGTYEISIAPDGNHCWTGGDIAPLTGTYIVNPMTVGTSYYSAPTKTYDGTTAYNEEYYVRLDSDALSLSQSMGLSVGICKVRGGGSFSSKDAGYCTFTPASNCTIEPLPETLGVLDDKNIRLSDLNITIEPNSDAHINKRRLYYTITAPTEMELGSTPSITWRFVIVNSDTNHYFVNGEREEVLLDKLEPKFFQDRTNTEEGIYYTESQPDKPGMYSIVLRYADGCDGNYELWNSSTHWINVTNALPKAADFTVAESNFTYSGNVQTPTVEQKDPAKDFGMVSVAYYNAAGDKVDEPINAGTYTVKVSTTETENYGAVNGLAIGSFTIAKAYPDASHFDLTPPADRTYSGTAKTATVTLKSAYTGMGEFTVKYYTDEAQPQEVAQPIDASVYNVYISAEGGTNFGATEEPVSLGSFTITPKEIEKPILADASATRTFGWVDVAIAVAKQHILVSGFDPEAMELNSSEGLIVENDEIYAIHAGTYNISITPRANYVWKTGTIITMGSATAPVEGSFTIWPKPVSAIFKSLPIEKTYDGTAALNRVIEMRLQESDVPSGMGLRLSRGTFSQTDVGDCFFTPDSTSIMWQEDLDVRFDCLPSDLEITLPEISIGYIAPRLLYYVFDAPASLPLDGDFSFPWSIVENTDDSRDYVVNGDALPTAEDVKIVFAQFRNGKKVSLSKPDQEGEYDILLKYRDETAARNYVLSSFSMPQSITAVRRTPTAADFIITDDEFTYDGTSHLPTVTPAEGKDFGEVSYWYHNTGVLATSPTDAGTYTIMVNTTETDMYNAVQDLKIGTFTIKKAIPTAEHFDFTPPADLVFNGKYKDNDTKVELKDRYTGMGSINVIFLTFRENTNESMAVFPRDPGTYYAGIFVTSPGKNFEETDSWVKLGEFTIEPRPVTVTAKNVTITYGKAIPTAFEYEASGLIEGHPLKGALATDATSNSNAGTYEITQGTLSANYNQYDITFKKGTLTIEKATPSYTRPSGLTATYGDTLKDVQLPDDWEWVNPDDSVGDAGEKTFQAIYTPGDTTNYDTVKEMLEITVSRKSLTKPTISGEYTYDGEEKAAEITGVDEATMTVSGDTKAKVVGNYTVTIALKDKNNYQWADGSTDDVTGTWTIDKESLTKPEISGSYIYDGAEKAAVISEAFDTATMTISGNTATDAGNYDVTISLKDTANYQWEDGTTDDVKDTWSIAKATLTKPTISGEYTYDGEEKAAEITGVDEATMTVSGDTKATVVGTYTVTIALKDKANYQWADGTTDDVTGTWTIDKASLTKPEISGSYIYDGAEKAAEITGVDEATMTVGGDTKATVVGTYTVTIALKDTANYQWNDETTEDVKGTWSIAKATLTKPTISGSYIYDGAEKAAEITGVDETTMTVTGDTKATAVGSYHVTITLKDETNYQWADGTTDDVKGTWSIAKKSLTKPTISGEYTYDGEEKAAEITGVDEATMTVSGDTKATNANTYTVTIALKDKANYQWSDGSADDVKATWSIAKVSLTKPTISGSYIYDGAEKEAVISEAFDETTMTVGGDTKATNVGSYDVTISLNDPANYQWADGTTDDVTGTWKIERLRVSMPRVSGQYVYNGSEQSVQINGYSAARMRLKGATSATDAMGYEISVSLKDKSNFCWSNGSTQDIMLSWRIEKARLNRPVVSGTYNFDGEEKQAVIVGFDEALMEMSGTTSATEPGQYTVSIALKDAMNYEWKNRSTNAVIGQWTIQELPVAEDMPQDSEETVDREPERMSVTMIEATHRLEAAEEVTSIEVLYAAESLNEELYTALCEIKPQEQILVMLTALLDCGSETDHACELYDLELSEEALSLIEDITAWIAQMDEETLALYQESLKEWFIIEEVLDEGETEPHREMSIQLLVTTTDAYTLEKYTFREKDGMWYFDRYEQIEQQ